MVVYNKMDRLSYHGVPMYVSKNPFLFGLSLSFVVMSILPLVLELVYIYQRILL